ncbi:TPA: hypothetical protein HA265_05815 [Candidatus Woesearchaeota archaeon]|nr:hypothetical protein [Candidatus Woesearchaeota archaeon]
MVDKDLIQRLHDRHIIDKRHVVWWQLGYEGRTVLSEEEFKEGLRTESWTVTVDTALKRDIEPTEKEFHFWKRDDVPILLRNIQVSDLSLDCFISVKPESHGSRDNTKFLKKWGLQPHIYDQPHIRGAVIDKTDRFLFWYPLLFGVMPGSYDSMGIYLKSEDMWGIICAVHPTRFYKKLIHDQWTKGRRNQTKAKEFDCEKEGYNIVPYFEFDTAQNHVMVYPVKLFERGLDYPVFIKSIPRSPGVEVIGTGYAYFDETDSGSVYYWELQKDKKKLIRKTLEQVLG